MKNKIDWQSRYSKKLKNNKIFAALTVAAGIVAAGLFWASSVKTSTTELLGLDQADKTFKEVQTNKVPEKRSKIDQLFLEPYHYFI